MRLPVFLQRLSKRRVYIRQIQGDSMLPLYKPGHILLAVRDEHRLQEGDVVLIRHGGMEKVKRLKQIRDDRIFVEGDNQAHSTDSRAFGWLHRSVVQAQVVWPRPLATRQWLRACLGVTGVLVILCCIWLFSL